jgi:hypothetical protein
MVPGVCPSAVSRRTRGCRGTGRPRRPGAPHRHLERRQTPSFGYDRVLTRAQFPPQFLASGQVRTDITAEYEMAELGIAIQRLADGATRGKSILRIT